MHTYSNDTKGDWQELDPDDERAAIFARASNPDVSLSKQVRQKAQDIFDMHKMELTSLLGLSIEQNPDSFLTKLLHELEMLCKRCGNPTCLNATLEAIVAAHSASDIDRLMPWALSTDSLSNPDADAAPLTFHSRHRRIAGCPVQRFSLICGPRLKRSLVGMRSRDAI